MGTDSGVGPKAFGPTVQPGPRLRVAVVGAGWAGLAAAVRATQAGHQVTLFEMARHLGGRARSLDADAGGFDNGQHILIGAYQRTLALMATVGVDANLALQRLPLRLQYADGRNFALPNGPQALAVLQAVLRCKAWTMTERAALLAWATRCGLRGFDCPADWTVERLCHNLPAAVRALLIDPLCVAALNTPATSASAQVMLRVLKDALLGGQGSADLLLPKLGLSELLPGPAQHWLANNGAALRLGSRVESVEVSASACQVNGEPFDLAVLACPPPEAARLMAKLNPGWSASAAAMAYEPIITVLLHCPGAKLPAPMTALVESASAPAQFAFDHGALGWVGGRFAFVISGASAWVERGLGAAGQAVLAQAVSAMPSGTWPTPPTLLRTLAEKRATFRCVPALQRPGLRIHPRILAAGDYVHGPYPATLEGAVRSGEHAVKLLG